jgi:hypothetical protein
VRNLRAGDIVICAFFVKEFVPRKQLFTIKDNTYVSEIFLILEELSEKTQYTSKYACVVLWSSYLNVHAGHTSELVHTHEAKTEKIAENVYLELESVW